MRSMLQSKYELNDLGELHKYLGITVTQNCYEKNLILSQELYAKKILGCFHLSNSLVFYLLWLILSVFLPYLKNAFSTKPSTKLNLVFSCIYLCGLILISKRCSQVRPICQQSWSTACQYFMPCLLLSQWYYLSYTQISTLCKSWHWNS